MLRRNRTSSRRKAFLIDSNQKVRRKPKIWRNRVLNFFVRLFFIKQILKLFRASVLFSLVLLGMLGFVVFALFSPYFELKQIDVVRDNPQINIEAIQEALEPFYGQNMIFLTDEEIRSALRENFPEFRDVTIREKWPDNLEISVMVSPPLYTLFNEETANFSTISEDGIILEQSPSEDLPVLNVEGYEKLIVPRTAFMTKEDLERIEATVYRLEEELKLVITEQKILPQAKEFHVVLEGGTQIWFDMQQDMEEQVRKLDLAASRISLYTEVLHHVDLRIPGQLFWE